MMYRTILAMTLLLLGLSACNQSTEQDFLAQSVHGVSTKELIDRYSECIELFPESIECRMKRGALFVRTGQYKKAHTDFLKISQTDSRNKEALMNLGLCDLNMNNFLEAVKTFTQVIELDSTNGNAYYNRGLAKAAFGANEDAVLDYTRSINIDSLRFDAYTNRGLTYKKLQQFDLAINDLLFVVSNKREVASAHYNLGLALFDSGQMEKGCVVFSKASSLGDGDATEILNRFCK